MKKMLKKASKTILIVMLLLVIDLSLLINCVQAADITKEKVYEIDYCDKVLEYQGIPRGAVYVVYDEGGKQYPAYCINPERIGVGDTDSYDVSVEGYITDVMLWRIVTNGYPYKTLGELGVANEKEAYLATKQAIYCYLDNRDVYDYSGIGEAGQRTLSALRQIWNNAQNSTETKISNVITIIPTTSEWKAEGEYITKTYKVQEPAPITAYNIKITGQNLSKGIKVTDTNNNAKEVFMPYEQFKVSIPASSLKYRGNFQINATTKMDTKPVLYGVSPNAELQNYALTTFTYEEAKGSYLDNYPENESQIKILKREKETQKPLQGVEFQLLNSNKEVIYQSLITNKEGQIIIKNIEPGTYYLKEVRTLEGYVLYDENIKIDISLNEKVNVTVNNTKEKNIEISKEVTNIEVGQTKDNIKENSSEFNTNKEKNKTNIEKEKNETNMNQENNITNIKKETNKANIEEKTNSINIEEKTNLTNIKENTNITNIQKLPKTGM